MRHMLKAMKTSNEIYMLLDEASLANESNSITFIFCIQIVSGLLSIFF